MSPRALPLLFLVAVLAPTALCAPMGMRRGLRAEAKGSWVVGDDVVSELEGVWTADLATVSIMSEKAAAASAMKQFQDGGNISLSQTFKDAMNLEKLVAVTTPEGVSPEEAIKRAMGLKASFIFAGANPSAGQWLGAFITENATDTVSVTGATGYDLSKPSGDPAKATFKGFSKEGSTQYEAFLEADGAITLYVYNYGSKDDTTGPFVAQMKLTKSDKSADELIKGVLSKYTPPAAA